MYITYMKNYTTMKRVILIALAAIGMVACSDSNGDSIWFNGDSDSAEIGNMLTSQDREEIDIEALNRVAIPFFGTAGRF